MLQTTATKAHQSSIMVTTVVLEEPHRSDLTSQQMAGLVEQDQVQQGQEHQGRTGAHPIISVDITEQMAEPAQHRAHQAQQIRVLLPLVLAVVEDHLLGYMTLRSNNQTHRVA